MATCPITLNARPANTDLIRPTPYIVRIISLICLALITVSNPVVSLADEPLTGTWQIRTETVTRVYTDTRLDGKTGKVAGIEFLSFNGDHTLTGSDWLLSGYLSGVEQANYDGNNNDFFPTSEALSPPITSWKQTGSGYQVVYDINRLRLTQFMNATTNFKFFELYLTRPWINRGVLPALGAATNGNPSDIIKRPYIYSYAHKGRLSTDQTRITGTVSVIVVDLDHASKPQRVIYINTSYTGSKFAVTSTCCGSDGTINDTASQEFLTAIDALPDVQKTDSGLRYIVLQDGTGAPPVANDWGMVSYRGFFPSGDTFDSGILTVSKIGTGLIDGWNEGLKLMKHNAKFRFYIPANLAYKDTGSGKVGPKSALVFDVELLNLGPTNPAP